MTRKSAISGLIPGLLLAFSSHASLEERLLPRPEPTRDVDLVIALDVSGSMSGLIDSAKQRLWDVVNEFGQASPRPRLRIAIISYGDPNYGEQAGFVRINQPFTTDLDAVNETLFSFGTNGGDEYVARVIGTATTQLAWSPAEDAVHMLFVAGNEEADQDPLYNNNAVLAKAMEAGIAVNTLYCGNQEDSIASGWASVAQTGGGFYASIDQNASVIANIAAPQDDELARLNAELNQTYVPYGAQGRAKRANQLAQDRNASSMSAPAAASRTVAKASSLYDAGEWDLVDAISGGLSMEEVETEALPEELAAMEPEAREAFVQEQAVKREQLREEINVLAEQRQAFIETERVKLGQSEGLDQALVSGIRQVASEQGLTFD